MPKLLLGDTIFAHIFIPKRRCSKRKLFVYARTSRGAQRYSGGLATIFRALVKEQIRNQSLDCVVDSSPSGNTVLKVRTSKMPRRKSLTSLQIERDILAYQSSRTRFLHHRIVSKHSRRFNSLLWVKVMMQSFIDILCAAFPARLPSMMGLVGYALQ